MDRNNYAQPSGVETAGPNHWAVGLAHDLLYEKNNGTEPFIVIEGLWAYEKLTAQKLPIRAFLYCPELLTAPAEQAIAAHMITLADHSCLISAKLCRKLSERDHPEGCFTICRMPDYSLGSFELRDDCLLIILDGLESPGNIGTIIRTAEGAGCQGVIICRRKVRLTNPRLIKAGMGATWSLPVLEAETPDLIAWLEANRFRIVLTDTGATKWYYEEEYRGRVAVVLGNERFGISGDWYEKPVARVAIPMFGSCDSLNVAYAAAIVTYEASLRQKGWLRR